MGVILVKSQRQAKTLVRKNYLLYCRCSLGERVEVVAFHFEGATARVQTSCSPEWLTAFSLWAELATQLTLWDGMQGQEEEPPSC